MHLWKAGSSMDTLLMWNGEACVSSCNVGAIFPHAGEPLRQEGYSGGVKVGFESGRLASLADGSCLLQIGDTQVILISSKMELISVSTGIRS